MSWDERAQAPAAQLAAVSGRTQFDRPFLFGKYGMIIRNTGGVDADQEGSNHDGEEDLGPP